MAKISASNLFFYLNILFIFFVFIFSLWLPSSVYLDEKSKVVGNNENYISLAAMVCEEAELGLSNRKLTLCADTKVLVITDIYPEYNYGDFLLVTGKLKLPEFFDSFDYPTYLARYGIYSLMLFPEIEQLQSNLSFVQKLKKKLLVFKNNVRSIINKSLPEPEAGLASAIILGYKNALSESLSNSFSRSGLRHIVAISGMHVAIISSFLISALRFLNISRRLSFYFLLLFFIIYPIITGLSASVTRASIMGFLGFLAFYSGRRRHLIKALVFVAALMLLFNPLLLKVDLGFRLSFASVLGIIYLEPILSKQSNKLLVYFKKDGLFKRFISFILSMLNLTISCQLATIPMVLDSFQEFSLVSPIANILVVWLLPVLLQSLIIAITISLLFPFLAKLLFFPVYLGLKFIVFIANNFSQLSFAVIAMNKFSFIFYLIYYSVLIFIIYKHKQKTFQKGRL